MSSQIVYRIAEGRGPERDTFEGRALKDKIAEIQGLTSHITFTASDLEISTFMDLHKPT